MPVLRCRVCAADLERPSRFCPTCGSSLEDDPNDDRTWLTEMPSARQSSEPAGPSHGSSLTPHPPSMSSAAWLNPQSSGDGGFTSGTIVGGRFRIIGLLGRGGMGDVYRADDLVLGQSVALKFLPAALMENPDRRARFFEEVRIARQVSHPNVCRVYDIGEIESQPYMSMELVDGDDLASLLRRIGRLPEDKALEVARQLCAGLAAAHEKGVLHRDLKPANVLIDAQGKVRITDFGLAVLVEQFRVNQARGGTPAYMAPEQLARNEVSVQSDIYSLGILLYEMFTGKRVYSGNTLAEVRRQQESADFRDPSTVLEDMDPVIESAILRCLERDPRLRPASALAVAAVLPGGDPLAAALAAGEIPSPDAVAAAGGAGGLGPARAWAVLGVFLAGVATLLAVSDHVLLPGRVPMNKPGPVLADRAVAILHQAGYTDPPADHAAGFWNNLDYLRWVRTHDENRDRWRDLEHGAPAIQYWYRQHGQHMRSMDPLDGPGVTVADPPLLDSGMATVFLDVQGHLTDLCVVPPQVDSTRAAFDPVDWMPYFALAGLEASRFQPAPSAWVPPVYSDARAAWTGSRAERPDQLLRVEVGSYRGKPNYFQIVGPWTRPARMTPRELRTTEKVASALGVFLVLALLVGAVLLARRSVRSGHADKRGATRLGVYILVLVLGSWLLTENHASNPNAEWAAFVPFLGLGLFLAMIYGVLYLGIEPMVRRRWPDSLIGWNRLLAGRWRDPRVGRDLLIGMAVGVVVLVLEWVQSLVPPLLGRRPPQPDVVALDSLRGFNHAAGLFLDLMASVVFLPMAMLMLLVLFRILLRKQWLAAGVVVLLLSFLRASGSENMALAIAVNMVQTTLLFALLLRFGLLAAMAANLVITMLGQYYPLTADFSHWWAPATFFAIGTLLLLCLYGFRTALADQPIFRSKLTVD